MFTSSFINIIRNVYMKLICEITIINVIISKNMITIVIAIPILLLTLLFGIG